MKAINDRTTVARLQEGDLWIRPLPEDEVAVVQVRAVQKQCDGSYHVTYDINWRWANDATYTEAFGANEDCQVLILAFDAQDTDLFSPVQAS